MFRHAGGGGAVEDVCCKGEAPLKRATPATMNRSLSENSDIYNLLLLRLSYCTAANM